MGVEPFRVLQGKDFRLESTASPDQYLNFRTPIAHKLAHSAGVIRHFQTAVIISGFLSCDESQFSRSQFFRQPFN